MKVCSVCHRYYEDSIEFCAENHGSLTAERSDFSEMIGNYRLGVLLERDAAGETYQATHMASDQSFTVKIIASNAAGAAEDQREKIQTETRAAVDIIHPNVARVYETGSLANGDFYVAAESPRGQTLREHLRNVGSLSETEAVTVARQAAEALAMAHAVGVVHRAVSPSNIILDTDQEGRLSAKLRNFDFGAVNEQTAVAEISAAHPPLDALRYLSPEQCARQAVDARTDVFSLGVTLYEMLCGRSPFDAPTLMAIVEKQINEQPLAQLRYDVRAMLTYLLKQVLQTSASARLSSATNFARQLRHIELLVAPPVKMPRAMPQSAETKKNVSDAAAFSDNAPRRQTNELPVENLQPREITEQENADVKTPMPVNPFAAQSLVGEIEDNTIDENNFSSESQPILVEKREVGNEPFAAEPIFVERKQPAHVESEDVSVALSESEPIRVAEEPLETFPRESESFFVKKENAAEAVRAPVTDIRMRQARRHPAPKTAALYVPSHASRLFSPRQLPLLVGASLFTLMAFAGLVMFFYSQQEESLDLERRAAEKTPVSSVSDSPRPMSDVSSSAAVTTESDAAETEELAPIAIEESPSTASPGETQNPPRRETLEAGGEATQPNEAVKPQPAREEPTAEFERADNELVETPTAGIEQTKLNSSLDEWVTATNARDVERQMNYYAPKVNTYYRARNASPDLVRAEKKRLFERANVVDIQTGKPEITLSRDGRSANMRFRKRYAIKEGQKSRSGEVIQELRWVKSGDDWKIVSERDVKVINR